VLREAPLAAVVEALPKLAAPPFNLRGHSPSEWARFTRMVREDERTLTLV
jgi:hypothetical protein